MFCWIVHEYHSSTIHSTVHVIRYVLRVSRRIPGKSFAMSYSLSNKEIGHPKKREQWSDWCIDHNQNKYQD
jgi:hypothetical protein